MDSAKSNSLENFVERHRADFDVHEPRPDLWAALEAQLDAPVASEKQRQPEVTAAIPPMMIVESTSNQQPEATTIAYHTSSRSWIQRYGIAASLAALVIAAGASEAWKAKPSSAFLNEKNATTASMPSDDALYLDDDNSALNAAERSGVAGDSQLTAAVRGMETYYVAQLRQREAELRELGDTSAAPGSPTEWQRQLVSLDSSYRLLKRELLHHPQPEALLTAMNRNLQIRLDILDQQLQLTATAPPDATSVSSAFILADSRQPQ